MDSQKILLLATLLLAGCVDVDSYVHIYSISVGPQMCELLENQFASEVDPTWEPNDPAGCDGYFQYSNGECLTYCLAQNWCGEDYFCDLTIAECVPRLTGGDCTSDRECLTNFCTCGVCTDVQALIEFGMQGI